MRQLTVVEKVPVGALRFSIAAANPAAGPSRIPIEQRFFFIKKSSALSSISCSFSLSACLLWKYQDICMFIFRSICLSSGLVQNKPWDPSISVLLWMYCELLRFWVVGLFLNLTLTTIFLSILKHEQYFSLKLVILALRLLRFITTTKNLFFFFFCFNLDVYSTMRLIATT